MKNILQTLVLTAATIFATSLYTFANNLNSGGSGGEGGSGQSYVITNTNDTIFGNVAVQKSTDSPTTITFTNGENNEQKTYEPFQIKGYFNSGTFYESKMYNLSADFSYGYNVFMERKGGEGSIKIYHFSDKEKTAGNTKIFIENEAGKMTEVNAANFRTQMADFFTNCPPLKAKILRGVYKKKDLEQITAEYNAWKAKNG